MVPEPRPQAAGLENRSLQQPEEEVDRSRRPLVLPTTELEDSEEKYLKQVRALEKRAKTLLPTLDGKLCTTLVQVRLEEAMKLPTGRLDRFRFDIARIWRELKSSANAAEGGGHSRPSDIQAAASVPTAGSVVESTAPPAKRMRLCGKTSAR
jgi:hypothetical protein